MWWTTPGEAKYRRIRRASTAFQQSLGGLPGGCESLQAIGFTIYAEPNGEEVRATQFLALPSGVGQRLYHQTVPMLCPIGCHGHISKAILFGVPQTAASVQLGIMQVLSMSDIPRGPGGAAQPSRGSHQRRSRPQQQRICCPF